jgi:hypothetical protein
MLTRDLLPFSFRDVLENYFNGFTIRGTWLLWSTFNFKKICIINFHVRVCHPLPVTLFLDEKQIYIYIYISIAAVEESHTSAVGGGTTSRPRVVGVRQQYLCGHLLSDADKVYNVSNLLAKKFTTFWMFQSQWTASLWLRTFVMPKKIITCRMWWRRKFHTQTRKWSRCVWPLTRPSRSQFDSVGIVTIWEVYEPFRIV